MTIDKDIEDHLIMGLSNIDFIKLYKTKDAVYLLVVKNDGKKHQIKLPFKGNVLEEREL